LELEWAGPAVLQLACDGYNNQNCGRGVRLRHGLAASGRLTGVDEMLESPSNTVYATTSYQYDTLDDLTSVTQGTQPQRTFVYDSLKRLIQAFNPESGPINYTYDADSNLTTTQDARGLITTYFYDALNRTTSKTYSDTTPPMYSYYDSQPLPSGGPPGFSRGFSTGRLVALTYGSASASAGNYFAYDQVGRVTTSFQQTDGQNYLMSYGYQLDGAMTSETYPSGRSVSTSYDAAGRISNITGQKTGESNKTYASSFSYCGCGGLSSFKLGNNLWEHTNYNTRLQPVQIGLGANSGDSSVLQLDYAYGAVNRQYAFGVGRFTRPDPLAGQIVNPQSFNRYAYCLNDPVNLTDELGLAPGCSIDGVPDRTCQASWGLLRSGSAVLYNGNSVVNVNGRLATVRFGADRSLLVSMRVAVNSPRSGMKIMDGNGDETFVIGVTEKTILFSVPFGALPIGLRWKLDPKGTEAGQAIETDWGTQLLLAAPLPAVLARSGLPLGERRSPKRLLETEAHLPGLVSRLASMLVSEWSSVI
jgi:RHS repeat-associated protein